ncbi:Hexapeptide repeat of succinyl-transferase [Duganella sp. CF402]|uniref:acyltransferase n=1 Tax=unclassified Duganella TaxID=2636909 RepID=UPI0008B46E43|nr:MULTISPECIES: DapH/DapD/GlmU-related protein [unclassified Duganella]RZT11414.1 succinyltransferase-like protein [Duganella sp. BK701]SEK65551.1 Hexapeptide repeat of succinyl-transferase [Duganella sp. CF402]
MRAIKPGQVAVFLGLLALILALAVGTTALLFGALPLGDFRGVTLVAVALLLVYLYAFLIYRCFLLVLPLHEGDVPEHSRHELAANVNILFYLLLFNSLIRTHFIPVPIQRLIYLALGARLGANTYSAGALLDPPLTHIGSNTIIGHDAVVFAHVIEGARLELKAVHIGNTVTIGAKAVVMAGVRIGDNAIVSTGAVVTKDTQIAAGEIWGGIPARRIKAAPA